MKKTIILILITFSLIFVSTGTYAYYKYGVNGQIKATAGNYTFNVSSESTTTKEINLGSNLKPFDKGSFNLTVNLNDTDSDAYFKMKINKINLPKGFKFLAQDDNISPFSTYSKYFKSNESKTDTVTVYWYWDGNIDDVSDNSFINKNISAEVVIESKQTNPAYMKNGIKKTFLSGTGWSDISTEFWSDNYKPYIRTINFGNDLSNLPSTCTEEKLCWDISENETQKKKVYGYLIDTGLKDGNNNTKSLYNLYIVSEAPIFAPNDSTSIFSFQKYENSKNISNLISINFNNNFNTANVTNMSGMFGNCSSLTSLDLNSFNTANVTNMGTMFWKCSSLTSLDLSSFNTANVTNMASMFVSCESLTNLDLSSFNTANVTTMEYMFENCSSLTSLNLSSFNTANVTMMVGMFWNCSSLTTTINIMNANVTNYSNMFSNAATASSAKITVNYTSSTSTLVDNMIATKSSNSNVVKGTQIKLVNKK